MDGRLCTTDRTGQDSESSITVDKRAKSDSSLSVDADHKERNTVVEIGTHERTPEHRTDKDDRVAVDAFADALLRIRCRNQ